MILLTVSKQILQLFCSEISADIHGETIKTSPTRTNRTLLLLFTEDLTAPSQLWATCSQGASSMRGGLLTTAIFTSTQSMGVCMIAQVSTHSIPSLYPTFAFILCTTLNLPLLDTSIGGECCTSSTTAQVTNPYAKFAASCQRTPGFGFVHFEIYLNSDITDGGKALHDQVDGCGAVTLWQFGTNESNEKDGSSANLGYYTSQYLASFNIDILFKTGCVGRAIHSAGGPAGVDC